MMKQMVAPNALVERTTTLAEFSYEFFRKSGDKGGRIFFRYNDPMAGLLFAPVLENGRLSKCSGEIINTAEIIEVISQEELGIGRIYWA